MKDLIENKCSVCHRVFFTKGKSRSGKCEECRKIAKPRLKHRAILPDCELHRFMWLLNKYNEEHKTSFNYGQMQVELSVGRISVDDFFKG